MIETANDRGTFVGDTTVVQGVKVIHLIESLGAGGAEKLLYTNLKHLNQRGIHSSVLTVFDHPDDWAEPIRELGVSIESLSCQGLRDLLTGIVRLRSWLRANQPDIVHTHLWAANIIGRVAGRLTKVPVISSVHNPDYDLAVDLEMSGWKRQLGIGLERWSARFGCRRMIAVSDYARRYAQRRFRFPADRIDLLYNPIDTEAFLSQPARGREELLTECGLPLDSLVLLNVGRVSPQKGLLHAIRAMPTVLARHASAQLISIGAISDEEWMKKLVAEAAALDVGDRTHFLGVRKDVIDFLRACDLFVFPSLFEGLGIALIEAMAAGRACLATDVGPIPEVVTHGVDGWLVPAGDSVSLAEAICMLLDAPARRKAMGRAASASALARFQPQTQADKLAAIYESVVAAVA